MSLAEIRGHLREVIDRAEAGAPTIVTRYRKAVAEIGPVRGAGQAHTVNLPSGASVTLTINGSVLNTSPEDREWLFDLIDMFKKHEAQLSPPPREAET